MSEFFLDIVNMSISASWLILVVLVLRLILKKAPKWVNVLLWGIVALRLICPVTIESALSLIPSQETISPEIMMDWTPEISTGIGSLDQVVNPVISTSFAPEPSASANPLQILIPVAANLWILGVLVMLLYTAVSYFSLRLKLRTAVILRDNIFQCETVHSPFVLGILKPRIYMPYTIDGVNLHHVVAHEQAHIRRKDHWWKPLGFLLLTVYWFNPLLWVAYILLCRDIELACDEKVIAELGNDQRADYTQALVACSVNRRMIAACPLAFGEVGVKERVKSIMNYRKPAFWVVVLALIACVTVAVCFLTNPVGEEPDLSFLNYENAISVVADIEELTAIYCPSSDEGSGASIQIGRTNGAELAKQLDVWDWKECNQPRQSLPSPGSVEFIIEKDYRITVHQKKSGSLRQYAVIKYQDDVRYYQIDKSDYPDAVALVHAPAMQSSVLNATILEIHNDFFLVKPVEGSWELDSADQIQVPMRNLNASPEPEIGDILRIEYNGELLETYPAQIGDVFNISVLIEKSKIPALEEVMDLPQEQLNEKLIGLSQSDLHIAWGEPKGVMHGFFGDIYHIANSNRSLMVHYSADGIVEMAQIEDQNNPESTSTYEIYNEYTSMEDRGTHIYVDLDEDGVEELFIYRSGSTSEIATISEGKVVTVMASNHLFLCDGGIIGRYSEGGGGCTVFYYKMDDNEAVSLVDVIMTTFHDDAWYRSTDPDLQYVTAQNMTRITKEEAQKAAEQYTISEEYNPSMPWYLTWLYGEE